MTEEMQIKLLKFADGELTPEEESCVLLDCEESPEQWKDLALAMVAERRLTEALADFDPSHSKMMPQAKTVPQSNRVAESPRESGWHSAARLTGMTLALVLAFVVGRQQTGTQVPVATAAKPSPALPQIDDRQPSPPTVAVAENDDATNHQYSDIDPWTVVSKPVFTEQDRSVFSEAGLDVEEENTIYIVNDANGGRWAIPWKAVNVRYSPTENHRH